jgi:hypothetical protein
MINLIAGALLAPAQQSSLSTVCQNERVKQAPAYKIGRTLDFSLVKYRPKLELFISVDPEHINSAEMTALAAQLNRDYCHAPQLYVRILDDFDIASNWSPVAYERPVFAKAWRGEYRLNRTTGEESINFSTARGKSIKEVQINLGSTKPPRPATRHRVRRKSK